MCEPSKADTVPDRAADYLRPSYWDGRFEHEENYEWCKSFADFRHLLLPHLNPTDRILVLGCGNSTLSADLWREGFRDVTSTDLSEVVLKRMRDATKGMPGLSWRVADMLDLPFADESFDAVLEKGVTEVLFADNDSPWDPKPEVAARTHQMLAEAHSFMQPHFRRRFALAPQFSWSFEHGSFGDTFHYFVYALRKGQRNPTESLETLGRGDSAVNSLAEPMTHEHMDRDDYLLSINLD